MTQPYDKIGVRYPWAGGECPVAPKTKVVVILRNGRKTRPRNAKGNSWKRLPIGSQFAPSPFDVIAFEIVEFAKP